jgi:hypothetical protein
MRLKENRKLTKKELAALLVILNAPFPESQTENDLFTTIIAMIKKPPPVPPPGFKKK